MSIAKEDIKPGWYWVLSRKNGELSIVRVSIYEIVPDCPTTAVEHHGWEVADEIETAMQEFDFLARIETPEFPS
jgi:hypothetical protein